MNAQSLIDDRIQFYEYIRKERTPEIKERTFSLNGIFIDPSSRFATYNGKIIKVRGKTFDTLSIICNRRGNTVSYAFLKRKVFSDKKWSRHESWVSAAIKHIRYHMGEDFIITVRRKGYKLNLNYDGRTERKNIHAA